MPRVDQPLIFVLRSEVIPILLGSDFKGSQHAFDPFISKTLGEDQAVPTTAATANILTLCARPTEAVAPCAAAW